MIDYIRPCQFKSYIIRHPASTARPFQWQTVLMFEPIEVAKNKSLKSLSRPQIVVERIYKWNKRLAFITLYMFVFSVFFFFLLCQSNLSHSTEALSGVWSSTLLNPHKRCHRDRRPRAAVHGCMRCECNKTNGSAIETLTSITTSHANRDEQQYTNLTRRPYEQIEH